nr:DUF58 domain-containing protein [Dolichospermum compactum]
MGLVLRFWGCRLLLRSLRPYRINDPTRLIYWRTSARYGELRVRELEVITGGQEILIAIDSSFQWQQELFSHQPHRKKQLTTRSLPPHLANPKLFHHIFLTSG